MVIATPCLFPHALVLIVTPFRQHSPAQDIPSIPGSGLSVLEDSTTLTLPLETTALNEFHHDVERESLSHHHPSTAIATEGKVRSSSRGGVRRKKRRSNPTREIKAPDSDPRVGPANSDPRVAPVDSTGDDLVRRSSRRRRGGGRGGRASGVTVTGNDDDKPKKGVGGTRSTRSRVRALPLPISS